MIEIINNGIYLLNNEMIIDKNDNNKIKGLSGNNRFSEKDFNVETCMKETITYNILKNHNISDDMSNLRIKIDAMASHDITYVGIVQTAKASGLEKFPVPYVLTNCHNSLCAVGGTINEDDHVFGITAAKRYGGIYVPAHQAVIHQYMREMMAGCGKMILGSDSHTRYGALGTMAIGEGGPELVKQLLNRTYDVKYPGVIAVYLKGKPTQGVGPQDVALAIIGEVFKEGFVKNKVMEFVGPGINNMSIDYRNGIDVMTTETTCLSSIWVTDEKVREYFDVHGRKDEYKELKPGEIAYYDGAIIVDLSSVKPMIALPFHPSNVFSVQELKENPYDILRQVEKEALEIFGNSNISYKLTDKIIDNKIIIDQGIIAGCSGGTYENIALAANILKGKSTGNGYFSLSVYPASQPLFYGLTENGYISELMDSGSIIKTAFCGPCFGAGDVPSNNGLSIRHTTRNFPNREGSKPSDGQIASVALMDARSIAATALNGGVLTGADEIQFSEEIKNYNFNEKIYNNRVYYGFGKPDITQELKYGPNIMDWPEMIKMPDNLLIKAVSVIYDPVTTTDELIPSGETSSYRSNPLRLAEFTLSRKDPEYVQKAKEVQSIENKRRNNDSLDILHVNVSEALRNMSIYSLKNIGIGSFIYANKPGDGSAREQAASCQKVLGAWGNIVKEYATKRYRSNCVNWGILPFEIKKEVEFFAGDYVFVPNIKTKLQSEEEEFVAYILRNNEIIEIKLYLPGISKEERKILLDGCLINYYKDEK